MISTILLQAAGGAQYTQYIMMGLIVVVFYFFMIRPQIKKQKDQKKYVDEMKKGDKIVTTAGIHGKVVEIADVTILVEVDNGVKIRFDKSAISLEASKALNPPVTKA
ncbi:preprotein translocase subunit YajC [Mucilaginibacter paludis]|uniref:Sec translocon accessory complex subunit YajC n=1 Tax=Mucilaginibacter paludis DSM 18603 TaxID=714943 RepID=H1Y7D9_9SPHI|nr:preprotein translocase subunit YajC [Mucilaginibacter paludis]EHQ29026.1 preprotein translocase, YajC subunit [Mucilaginibacter paludis DSM 18603]